jgi:F-type H+-transporting ATPase subunit a
MGLNHDQILEWQSVVGGLLTLALITIMGLSFKKSVEASGDNCEPEGKFSLRTFIEMIFDFVNDLARDIIGEKSYGRFMFLLTGLFLFIFISNLSGLIPGFPPATESINTNLAMSGIVFLVYNWVGIKEHKGSYVKQFIGPLWWMAPLMVVIEVIAHIARPISLSLRLYGNIFGDHLVLSVFTGLTYVIVPAFLLFFGLLVASLQSFVFTLLIIIYISMAISHDH